MKKFFLIMLRLVLVFGMSACEKLEKLEAVELPPLPTATPAPTPVPEKDEPAEEAKEDASDKKELDVGEPRSNQIIINTKKTVLNEYDPAKGEELILTYEYDTPIVFIEGRDDAAAKINDYIALLDESYYTGNAHGEDTEHNTGGFNMMLELAQDNFGYVMNSGAKEIPLEFTASRTASVAYADSNILSIVYSIYQYTGGAHGIYADRAYVFDTETGEELSLDRITTDFDSLCAALTEYMVEQAENNDEIAERIDSNIVPAEEYSAAFGKLLREGSWYFNSEGLVFFSDVYELGSYAQGMLEITVPYDVLEGKIYDKYMPEERSGEVELEIKFMADIVDGTTDITDLVTVNEEGSEFCIIINGTAFDVKLSSGDYTERFFETEQLWYASYVQNSAIQLIAEIPEGMPNLMISYSDAAGESHRWLISQSGKDGSLILVDENIEAVG